MLKLHQNTPEYVISLKIQNVANGAQSYFHHVLQLENVAIANVLQLEVA